MKAKPGEIKFGWNTRERDLGWAWGEGCAKADGNLLYGPFAMLKVMDGKTLVEELESRGYDLTTLKFSIRKKT